jgi:hypothetical protein
MSLQSVGSVSSCAFRPSILVGFDEGGQLGDVGRDAPRLVAQVVGNRMQALCVPMGLS